MKLELKFSILKCVIQENPSLFANYFQESMNFDKAFGDDNDTIEIIQELILSGTTNSPIEKAFLQLCNVPIKKMKIEKIYE